MPSGIFTLKQQELALGQGAWTNQKPLAVDYLVVAGGGAGAYQGAGGAGGLLQGNIAIATSSAITVTVGGGGAGAAGGAKGSDGSNSVFGSISAFGGGAGGGTPSGATSNGNSGGSGGGSADSGTPIGIGGQGTAGQGNRGGNAATTGASGGGGGAGTPGLNGVSSTTCGNGGAGVASDISGTRTTYAGGGGGGPYSTNTAGAGGAGGGGNGGTSGTNSAGQNGSANTGGGAGGSAYNNAHVTAASGGSGIVIISYPDTYAAPASTTGSPTVSTSGSGSIGFNGSTQVLVYNPNSAFQFGTGNFTWETWVYKNNTADAGLFDLGGVNSAGSFGVFIAGGTIYVRIDGSSNDLTYAPPAGIPTGAWIHLAVVRNGSTITLYYNGSSAVSGTRSNNVTQSTPYIGGLSGFANYFLNGYLSNTRVVKGSAVYTSNFTPSTAPLTAVTNTSLLLNSVSGAYLADSSTNGFAPTSGTVTPTWNQLSPFATGLGYKNRVYTWTSSGSITF